MTVAVAAAVALAPHAVSASGVTAFGGGDRAVAHHTQTRTVAFEAPPLPPPTYAIAEDTEVIRVPVEGDVELYVEAWRPAALDGGRTPPPRLPVVLTLTPYAMERRGANTGWDLRQLVVPRGYIHAVAHTRGFGSSGGCNEWQTRRTARDASAVIKAVADQWSDGRVALTGLSNPASEALNALARGDAAATALVKAAAVGAPFDLYEAHAVDGVPKYLTGPAFGQVPYGGGVTNYSSVEDIVSYGEPVDRFVTTKLEPGGVVSPDHADDRTAACDRSGALETVTVEPGSHSPGYQEVRWKIDVPRIKTPVLFYQGFEDAAVHYSTASGIFDRFGGPKAGLFGRFGHVKPPRADWDRMTFAWLERWVRGVSNGVDSWPIAQIESPHGEWRVERGWPRTGGPSLALALSPSGLGDSTPKGSSTFTSGALPFDRSGVAAPLRQGVSYETRPLQTPLILTGEPVIDATLDVDAVSDAHLAAELVVVDASGNEVEGGWTFGARSMRHLDDFADTLFVQSDSRDIPTETVQVPIRLAPLDVTVPVGGRIRLFVGTSARVASGPDGGLVFGDPTTAEPGATFTIHHDCASARLSTLHILTARQKATFLSIDDADAVRGFEPPKTQDPIGRSTICGHPVARHPLLGAPS